MKSCFENLNNIHNRFFFIYGNTNDRFCGNNLVVMDLKFSLIRHLKDCGYERVFFYERGKRIHFYDDDSSNLARKRREKTEAKPAPPPLMERKGLLKGRRTFFSARQPNDPAVETTNVLHFGGMAEIDAFNTFDKLMRDENPKTAFVITNADDFFYYFGGEEQIRNKMFNSFNEYDDLGHKNFNIMLFIFPSPVTASENMADLWNLFFKPRWEKGKITEIHISPPLADEVRNAIHYCRLMCGLELYFPHLDDICGKIAKNFYAERPALDSLVLLLMKLQDLADKKMVLNNETADMLLEEQGNGVSKARPEPHVNLVFRGILTKLSDEEIRKAEDIACDKGDAMPIDEILRDLDNMVGMTEVKKTVRELAANLKLQRERVELEKAEAAAKGVEYKPGNQEAARNHTVITGNPGTGKTTIVRTLAKLFRSIGLTDRDTPMECHANDLKGSHVGEAKDNVNWYCDSAFGGVLFLDEAYSLVDEQGPVDSYAKEVIDTLLKRMEDDGDKFITIAAGYQNEMGLFLDKSNPGTRSRFVHFIHLPDYTAEELIKIFEDFNVKSAGFSLSDDAREAARRLIRIMTASRGPRFGNAREMRELFNRIKRRQASRLLELTAEERKEKLYLIEAADIGEDVKPVSVNDVLAELDVMVGMKDVKETVRGIANKLALNKKIMEKTGNIPEGEGNHVCITGNPGTGKSSIARILAKLFKAIGLLADDKPVEIQAADLKGSYVGQSKDKVHEYCRQAMGRVLFIDEAYSLVNEYGSNDLYAEEAIPILMAHLENDRDKFVCIIAGYPREMDILIKKSNPGMERRFKHYIHIPDYSADELVEIFERCNVEKKGFTLTDAARKKAREAIRRMVENKAPNFGNAGAIRTFFEKITGNTANRVSALPDDQQIAVLQVIEAEDIP